MIARPCPPARGALAALRGCLGAAVIDLHCHILPALDDGATDLADSVAMARQADTDGIATVCATPHIRHDHDVVLGELPDRVAAVNAELERQCVGARVVAGAEVAETAVPGLSDAELRQATLGGGGRWLLLEPAPGVLGDSLLRHTRELATRGFRCVIAHPERHAAPDIAQRLAALVHAGALVQVTAAHLAHPEAAPVIVGLADRGLVHLLGSDAHSARIGRPVMLSEGLSVLKHSRVVSQHLPWVAELAPAAILHGEDPVPPFAVRP